MIALLGASAHTRLPHQDNACQQDSSATKVARSEYGSGSKCRMRTTERVFTIIQTAKMNK
jgi:hypothetical protein